MQVRYQTFQEFKDSLGKFLSQINRNSDPRIVIKNWGDDSSITTWLKGKPIYFGGKEHVIKSQDHIDAFKIFLLSRKTDLIYTFCEDNYSLLSAIEALKTQDLKELEVLTLAVIMSPSKHTNDFIRRFLSSMTTQQVLENILNQMKGKEKGNQRKTIQIFEIENALKKMKGNQNSSLQDYSFFNPPSFPVIMNNIDPQNLKPTHELENTLHHEMPSPSVIVNNGGFNKRKATDEDLNSNPAKKRNSNSFYKDYVPLFKDAVPSCPYDGVLYDGVKVVDPNGEIEPINWWKDENGDVYTSTRKIGNSK